MWKKEKMRLIKYLIAQIMNHPLILSVVKMFHSA